MTTEGNTDEDRTRRRLSGRADKSRKEFNRKRWGTNSSKIYVSRTNNRAIIYGGVVDTAGNISNGYMIVVSKVKLGVVGLISRVLSLKRQRL